MNQNQALPAGSRLQGHSYAYEIESVLGQGSFGITYRARLCLSGELGELSSNVTVAVKEFFMKDINGREGTSVTSGSNTGVYSDYKAKFKREAVNLSHMKHPGIVKVLEAFEANNTFYYAMEYIEGGSLDKYIGEWGGLPEREALDYLERIGSALAFMHDNRMLHLDLKPLNVMRRADGQPVLIDFGLSKQYGSDGQPESSTTIGGGTPGYAPLEQANYHEGRDFPVTLDVYALGATLYKMLTGQTPPVAADVLNDGFPEEPLLRKQVSRKTIEALRKAMSPMKKERWQTVGEFLGALEGVSVVAGEGTEVRKPMEKVTVKVEKPLKPEKSQPEVVRPSCEELEDNSIMGWKSFLPLTKVLLVLCILISTGVLLFINRSSNVFNWALIACVYLAYLWGCYRICNGKENAQMILSVASVVLVVLPTVCNVTDLQDDMVDFWAIPDLLLNAVLLFTFTMKRCEWMQYPFINRALIACGIAWGIFMLSNVSYYTHFDYVYGIYLVVCLIGCGFLCRMKKRGIIVILTGLGVFISSLLYFWGVALAMLVGSFVFDMLPMVVLLSSFLLKKDGKKVYSLLR